MCKSLGKSYFLNHTMAKLTKKKLLEHLTKSDKEDIIREVSILFDKFKNVKEFYAAELSDAENPLLEKYKKKITYAYSAENPKERRTNLNVNKLICEFKKISIYERELADLMLHRVECGMEAVNRNNNRTSTFYNCIINTFEEALSLISAGDYSGEFKQRIYIVIKAAKPAKYETQARMKEFAKGI
jgi:Family of unknown function (DUF6155)